MVIVNVSFTFSPGIAAAGDAAAEAVVVVIVIVVAAEDVSMRRCDDSWQRGSPAAFIAVMTTFAATAATTAKPMRFVDDGNKERQ